MGKSVVSILFVLVFSGVAYSEDIDLNKIIEKLSMIG